VAPQEGSALATILKGATLIELEPPLVERGDLRVDAGTFTARGPDLPAAEGDEVIDLAGKLVMPGLVCAHHHLYSSLARGMPPPRVPPERFVEILERVWWRMDQCLDLDTVEVSAMVGALDALQAGTTSVVDHHASPGAISGSLVRVARGTNEVGLRGVLCYEVTDRHGALGREEGIEETVSFHRKARGRFRGVVGAHASFTLGEDALAGLAEAVKTTGAGLHIHLAEDPADEALSHERFGESPVARLTRHGLLNDRSIVAHAVHLTWPELSQVLSSGAWLVHNVTSNMGNQVGHAPTGKFGPRATLGTDGTSGDMFAEAQRAYFRAHEAGVRLEPLKWLANGHRLMSQVFGMPVGPLREGAAADAIILDYRPHTPLTTENLESHFLYGFSARHVESAMVDGVWRMWARRPLSVMPEALAQRSRDAALTLWARMAELP
jgi:putative selenium metabolism protein SsnA